ncbi:MAG: tryptophan synthase subunit alpha [Nitrospirae bacterium]|nr:tryptophan synthase subunit alpha [Nitrospirota bacterium]
MSRIEETFRRLKKKEKKAFIPYIMAGDPSLTKTRDVVLIFEKCGADIVEIGVPFSDPLADGPTIQRSSERALESGITLRKVINFVKELREHTTIPIVLMTYYNPVFRYGEEDFIKDAKNAGVDGVIIPDLPPDEAGSFIFLSRKAFLDTIFLLAPTSNPERLKKVVKATRGFIYYVSITGITGSKLLLNGSMEAQINEIRKYTKKPVAVGFGVSTPEEAFEVSKIADGVIVGSAIVKRLNESPEDIEKYIVGLREAIE